MVITIILAAIVVQYLKLHISINVQNWPQQISIMMISWGLLIKENAIEEEERLEVSFEDNEEEEEEEDEEEIEDLRLHINDGSDEALPPPSFYQSASANSSNSSLKRKLLRKPFPTHHQAHCLQHQDQEPKQVDIKYL